MRRRRKTSLPSHRLWINHSNMLQRIFAGIFRIAFRLIALEASTKVKFRVVWVQFMFIFVSSSQLGTATCLMTTKSDRRRCAVALRKLFCQFHRKITLKTKDTKWKVKRQTQEWVKLIFGLWLLMMPMRHRHRHFPVSRKLKTQSEPAMHSASITNPVSAANYSPKTAEKYFLFHSSSEISHPRFVIMAMFYLEALSIIARWFRSVYFIFTARLWERFGFHLTGLVKSERRLINLDSLLAYDRLAEVQPRHDWWWSPAEIRQSACISIFNKASH